MRPYLFFLALFCFGFAGCANHPSFVCDFSPSATSCDAKLSSAVEAQVKAVAAEFGLRLFIVNGTSHIYLKGPHEKAPEPYAGLDGAWGVGVTIGFDSATGGFLVHQNDRVRESPFVARLRESLRTVLAENFKSERWVERPGVRTKALGA
jgi:hypothetical protein